MNSKMTTTQAKVNNQSFDETLAWARKVEDRGSTNLQPETNEKSTTTKSKESKGKWLNPGTTKYLLIGVAIAVIIMGVWWWWSVTSRSNKKTRTNTINDMTKPEHSVDREMAESSSNTPVKTTKQKTANTGPRSSPASGTRSSGTTNQTNSRSSKSSGRHVRSSDIVASPAIKQSVSPSTRVARTSDDNAIVNPAS